VELCKKKEKNLTPLEKILAHYGDAWVWLGFDPIAKIVPAFVVGKRTKANAYKLVERIYRVTDGAIPLFTSDELRHYRDALLRVYGIHEEAEKRPRRRGRPRKPKLRPPPELRYAQVVKHRRKGRVVSITTKVIFGKEHEVKELLEASPVSTGVNISFVERNNLSVRQQSKRLARKTNGFSKDIGRLEAQLCLALGYYHFVKEHFGLRRASTDNRIKWAQRTPAMAASITDHIWSTRELLMYRVP
jgi:IS1 family transposase